MPCLPWRYVVIRCAGDRDREYYPIHHTYDRNVLFMSVTAWAVAFGGMASPQSSVCLESLQPFTVVKMSDSLYNLLAATHSKPAEPPSSPFFTLLRETTGGISSITYRRPPPPPPPIYYTSTPYVYVDNPQPPPPPLIRARPAPSAPPLPLHPAYAPHFHPLYWMRRALYFELCARFLQR